MKYLSLFSGIEAATAAWQKLGWEAVAFSEIEPFPCEVLKHHYPEVPNLGDVTKITETDIKKLGQIDLVVFGSPCQDLSVAGKRKGFEGERSSLFRDAVRIIKWARKHGRCRFALWENVPGAFSSNQGRDFNEVLRLLTGSEHTPPQKGWQTAGVAHGKTGLVEWRTLNAQYFGVPQRRRRIFALADFGNWAGRQPILFESKGLSGNIKSSRKEGQGVTLATEKGSHWDSKSNPHPCLNQSHNISGIGSSNQEIFSQRGAGIVETFDFQSSGEYGTADVSATLSARDYKSAKDLVVHGSQDPIVSNNAHAIGRNNGLENVLAFSAKDFGGDATKDLCPTLRAGGHDKSHANSGNWPAIAFNPVQEGMGLTGIAPPIGASEGGGNQGAVCANHQVRRLTPIECERLQGFSDNYTRISWRNKDAADCPDGPRYRAIGNSIAIPCLVWIAKRINFEIDRLESAA